MTPPNTSSRGHLRVGERVWAETTGRSDYHVGQTIAVDYGPGNQQHFRGEIIEKDEFTLTLEDRVGNRATLLWPHLGFVTLLASPCSFCFRSAIWHFGTENWLVGRAKVMGRETLRGETLHTCGPCGVRLRKWANQQEDRKQLLDAHR